jgi:hypothetical protein
VEILRLSMADISRANITKLNNDNYSVWKFKLELLLMKEDLWSQVSTKTQRQLRHGRKGMTDHEQP